MHSLVGHRCAVPVLVVAGIIAGHARRVAAVLIAHTEITDHVVRVAEITARVVEITVRVVEYAAAVGQDTRVKGEERLAGGGCFVLPVLARAGIAEQEAY